MYEHMTTEALEAAIADRKRLVRENPRDANNSEEHAPAIHYMTKELERRGSIQEERGQCGTSLMNGFLSQSSRNTKKAAETKTGNLFFGRLEVIQVHLCIGHQPCFLTITGRVKEVIL